MTDRDDIVIAAARRTPVGSLLGVFSDVSATHLGSTAIAEVVRQSGIEPASVDEVIMGCVLPAGLGQAPARQAALGAGLPTSTGCTTVNKVCGSGMKAVMLAHDLILAGSARVVVAGGMESMTNAPYLVPKVRQGYRFGHQTLLDHMFLDGLENAYDKQLMGTFAERCVRNYAFTREDQDAFAIASVKRALQAIESGAFVEELCSVEVKGRGGATTIDKDEQPFRCDVEKIPKLKPAFDRDNGTVTAANSSSISDGAAALLITQRAVAEELGLTPVARIVAHSTHANAPEDFTTAPIGAVRKLSEKTGWSPDSIDLLEINEAFAVVTMAAMRDLELDHDRVNIHGGACALGHPIGASGARILVTLIHALKQRGKKRGVASLCIGGGEATAVAVEMLI